MARHPFAIILTSANILTIRPLGTYFNEIYLKSKNIHLRKMHLKISSTDNHLGTGTDAWENPIVLKQGKSEGFDSCDRPNNFT